MIVMLLELAHLLEVEDINIDDINLVNLDDINLEEINLEDIEKREQNDKKMKRISKE